MKFNRTCANWAVFFLIYKVVHYMTFEVYFFIGFISKMNDKKF